MRLDAKTWAEVRRLYGLGDVTFGALATQFGVSPKTIQGRCQARGLGDAAGKPGRRQARRQETQTGLRDPADAQVRGGK